MNFSIPIRVTLDVISFECQSADMTALGKLLKKIAYPDVKALFLHSLLLTLTILMYVYSR